MGVGGGGGGVGSGGEKHIPVRVRPGPCTETRKDLFASWTGIPFRNHTILLALFMAFLCNLFKMAMKIYKIKQTNENSQIFLAFMHRTPKIRNTFSFVERKTIEIH